MSKYCLGEIVKSKAEFTELVSVHMSGYKLIELWVDFIEDFSEDFFVEQTKKLGAKLIVLFRRNDDQDIKLSLEKRKHLIEILAESKSYLDLDVVLQKDEIEFYQSLTKKPKLIASYHNYKTCPANSELERLYAEMCSAGAEIPKFACFCSTKEDSIRLIEFYNKHSAAKPMIVLGMGEHAAITRITALLYDQPIIYAPRATANFVAPGQLTLKQYRGLQRVFNLKG